MIMLTSRSLASLTKKLTCSNDLIAIRSVVILSPYANSKRYFSIDQIGKRYEKPFDYKNKQYGLWDQFTDSTLKRLGENSLIISVEGNFGTGKSALISKLAKEIDFVQAREPDLNHHVYTTDDGINLRDIVNEYAAGNKRYYADSLDEFHLQPSFKRTIALQHAYYNIKWMQHRTALLHLLSTGKVFEYAIKISTNFFLVEFFTFKLS
jgi:hypothetical protein